MVVVVDGRASPELYPGSSARRSDGIRRRSDAFGRALSRELTEPISCVAFQPRSLDEAGDSRLGWLRWGVHYIS